MKPFVIQIVGGDLGGINARLDDLTTKLGALMVTTAEVKQLATDIVAAVAPLGDAINALEAQITALKTSGALTPQQQQDLDDAFAALTSVKTNVDTAVADAKDNIDEGAGSGGPV